MKDRFTADEFQAMMAGKLPKGVPVKKATGKPKIAANKCKADGFTFDSQTERRYYEHLKADPCVLWVDVHPVFTLSTGRRYTADFLVWFRLPSEPLEPEAFLAATRGPEVVDVKGLVGSKHDSWRRFVLIREDFDKHHPLAPLRAVTWDRHRKMWRDV